MSLTRFDQLRVLIIEDNAEMRASLRSMLLRFGAHQIDNVISGEAAIEALKIKPYDLILSDYELGRGKDGQQILEEVRYGRLIAAGACFVLVTAAQTIEMVMGALEYQPDGYITKPVTFDVVHKRLNKILKHKNYFSEINAAIDAHHLPKALHECDRLVMHEPRLATQVYRIKAKLLFETENYTAAEKIYQQVVDAHSLAWAELGLARCLHAKNLYQCRTHPKDSLIAIDILKKLIAHNEKYVECYDLLAKIQADLHQFSEAQSTLEQAIEQSPKAVLRQSELARIALHNQANDTAVKAARKAIHLSKNSCHHAPDNYLNLARALQDSLVNGSQRDKTLSGSEIQNSLAQVRRNFAEDSRAQLQATLTEGVTLHHLGKISQAQKLIQQAMQSSPEFAADNAIQTELDNALTLVGIAKDGNINASQTEAARKTAAAITEIENLNNKAVGLFEQGDLAGARVLFEQAAQHAEAKTSVLLNALQAVITDLQKQTDKSLSDFENCHNYLMRLNRLGPQDSSYIRREQLKTLYQELQPPENLSFHSDRKGRR